MSSSHEVISAFLDDRTFELEDLAATLEQPDGRALFLDLLALRRLVQPNDAVPALPRVSATGWSWLRPAVAAAAVVAALAVGYLAGVKRAPAALELAAPAATRVVQVTSTSQEAPQGVHR